MRTVSPIPITVSRSSLGLVLVDRKKSIFSFCSGPASGFSTDSFGYVASFDLSVLATQIAMIPPPPTRGTITYRSHHLSPRSRLFAIATILISIISDFRKHQGRRGWQASELSHRSVI